MEAITLDQAIKMLEITDISKVTEENLEKYWKRAKVRWHPNNIVERDDPDTYNRYEENCKVVDLCRDEILKYLSGELHGDEKYAETKETAARQEPEEIIRENAPNIQET